MLPFSNENCKMILYLSYIMNIHSHSFLEQTDSCVIEKDVDDIKPKSVNKNSQINSSTSSHLMEIKESECVALDLTVHSRKSTIYDSDQKYPLSLVSNTREDFSSYTLSELNRLEESYLCEIYKEIHDEALNTSTGNKFRSVEISDSDNNQIVKSVTQVSKLHKYIHDDIFNPNMIEEFDVTSKMSKNSCASLYNYDETQFDDIPLFFSKKLTDSRRFDWPKTSETNYDVHENVVISRSNVHKCDFPLDTRMPQYLSYPPPLDKSIELNSMAFRDPFCLPVETGTISNIITPVMNTNKYSDHSKRDYMRRNSESIGLRHFQGEPLRKMPRNISTDMEEKSSLIPSTPQIISSAHEDIIHTKNQPEKGYTIFPSTNAEEDFIMWDITDTNTSKKTFINADFNSLHLEQAIPEKFFEVSMKDYKRTEEDEVSLKRISEDSYNFNFVIKDTLISWSFDQKDRPYLFLEISSTSIRATDIIFAESVFNISIRTLSLYSRHYIYSIPIFHTVDFINSKNIDYFSISVITSKYGMNQTINIYIYRLKKNVKEELHLKCPRIRDFKGLIDKLLQTTFPIYPFPETQKDTIIKFYSLNHSSAIKEMTINEFIKDVTENPLNIRKQLPKEHNLRIESHIGKMKYNKKLKICWETGLKIVYEIYEIFHTNIAQISKIIDENSKTIDFKKVAINNLLDQIIQEIKKVGLISYPREIKKENRREWELMSFYAFFTNEVQVVLEWWNKYVFVIGEVQYIADCK